MKNFLIVDANSILNRAFYGIRPLSTSDGLPTNALYGFVTIIKKHLDALSPEYVLCAFDMRAPTFRHKIYDQYKATRQAMPEDLARQMPYSKDLCRALGFYCAECEGYEADDIIGTAASLGERESGIAVYILTGDRDDLQLISPKTSVILAKTKEDVLYDTPKFTEEYGVRPDQFIDVKALMGDSSDNIPGVRGVGEKTALKLISENGSLDKLYADETLGGSKGALLEKLKTGRDNAFLSRTLATIKTDVPVPFAMEDVKTVGADTAALFELFTKLEFFALIKRFSLEKAGTPTPAAAEICPECAECGADELLSLPEKCFVSFVESDFACDLCVFADDKLYRYSGADKDVLKEFFATRKIICHDYKSLISKLSPYGVRPACAFDTMTSSYLLSPGDGNYTLARIAGKYLRESAENISPAAEAYLVCRLYGVLSDELEKCGMTALLCDMEIPLSSVLYDMEREGMTLDREGLRSYMKELSAMQDDLGRRIFMAAGHEFNINSPKQLGQVLFEELSIPGAKKTKTGYSTDADTLARIAGTNEIVRDVLDWRTLAKLRGTYGENLIALCDENSRIHTTFNQCSTATGRLSSADPNMQNIPVRGELGREIRKYFTSKSDDYVLIDADYSQIELRVVAHMSGDTAMQKAFLSGGDFHTTTASEVFGIAPEDVTHEMRRRAKAVNFGIVYGIGDYSLSQDLHISRAAAAQYIANYLATYSGVARFLKTTVERAHIDGYTVTMFGRRRSIPELSSNNKNIQAFGERAAMNSPVQGSAADIIKIAMINTSRALEKAGIDAHLILQVHDELIVEAHADCANDAADILKREMENAASLSVPLSVDISTSRKWY